MCGAAFLVSRVEEVRSSILSKTWVLPMVISMRVHGFLNMRLGCTGSLEHALEPFGQAETLHELVGCRMNSAPSVCSVMRDMRARHWFTCWLSVLGGQHNELSCSL